METILKRELRKHVNRYELLGNREDLVMASIILTTLLNLHELDDVEYGGVNID